MGISQQELTKGNTEQVLLKVSDALRQNHDAASRLVAVQTLFGRTGRNLLPVLMAGSAGIHKLLDEQKATGNYLSGKGYAAAHAMVIEQRALSREWEGAKVQLGQSLLPAMLKFVQALGWLIKIARPATKHGQLLVFTIAALGAALLAASVATKVYVGATNLAKIATALWTAVQWTLNTAFYGFPVIWIIAAIALVIVAVYELVRHWQTVVHALDVAWHAIVHGAEWVWNWLKKNWPLVLAIITGPLGLLVYEIVTHWKQIEHFVLGVVHSIEHAIERLVGLIKSIPSKLGHGLLGLASHIPGFGLAKSIGGSILGAFAAGGTASTSGPYLVGEQGAEIVTLPRGAVVSPISLPQLAAATGQGGSPLQLTIPLIVDGRELARAIARVTSDQLARR